jgi:hypothetical protein
MKKVFELIRLNEVVFLAKQWIKQSRKKDDDMFDELFIIYLKPRLRFLQ